MCRGGVMVENPFGRPKFRSFPPKILVTLSALPNNTADSHLSLCNEFIVNYPLVIEEAHKQVLNCELDVLFSAKVNSGFPLRVLAFCFQVVLKTSRFLTGNDSIKHISIV
jgi:hypothetical protein